MAQNTKAEHITKLDTKLPETDNLVETVVDALLDKKGENIKLLDVRDVTTITDYFIICHGTSETQIKALARSVSESVKEKLDEHVWQKEGLDSKRWVILDYVNVVVHIFNEETRDFYALEKMWNDATITEIKDS